MRGYVHFAGGGGVRNVVKEKIWRWEDGTVWLCYNKKEGGEGWVGRTTTTRTMSNKERNGTERNGSEAADEEGRSDPQEKATEKQR